MVPVVSLPPARRAGPRPRRRPAAALLAAAALAGPGAPAALTLDWVTLTPSVRTAYSYESNASGRADGEAGQIVRTGAYLNLRRDQGLVTFTGAVGVTWIAHLAGPGEDDVGPYVDLTVSGAQPPWSASLAVGYSIASEVDLDLAERVGAGSFHSGATLAYRPPGRWGAEAVARATARLGRTGDTGSTSELTTGLRAIYAYSDELDLFGGYDYTWSADRPAAGADAATAAGGGLVVGIRGGLPVRLFPGLEINLSANYQAEQSRSDGATRSGGLGVNIGTSFNPTPLNDVTVSLGHDFSAALDGSPVTTTTAALESSQRLGAQWRAGGRVSWERSDIQPGPDNTGAVSDRAEAGATLRYQAIINLGLTLGASYSKTWSDDPAREFDQITLTVGADATW